MGNPPTTDLVSTCSSLTSRALSGAQEIESILLDRIDEAETVQIQRLRLLATKLQQLSKDADELQAGLRETSSVSAELQTTLSPRLAEFDATAAVIVKQVMRLGKDTRRGTIYVPTISQYESFAESATRFVFFTIQLLSGSSVQDQQAKLTGQDAKLLFAAVGTACQNVERSSGLLLDISIIGRGSPGRDMPDAEPPAYLESEAAPPPFDEHSDSGCKKPKTDGSSSSSRASSNGFLSSLARPFEAATAALRTKPEPLVVPLCQATTAGNVAQLRSLLGEGANVNGRNENGRTALICATLAGQLDAAQFLLDAGADHRVLDAGREGKPPLFHAIDSGNQPIAELLLKYGADTNQKDDWGQGYFMSLITGDTAPKWIELFLSYGADASAKDLSGRPLVVLAIEKRKKVEDREQVVRLLLRHGAKLDSSGSDGTPLIFLCLQQKRLELVHELLAMGADPNAHDVSGITLLATAIEHNDHHLTRTLLECRADPNAPDIYGSKLILTVLRDSKFPAADREVLAELLLEHGARGDVKDILGVTALEHALTPIVEGIGGASSPSSPPGSKKLRIPELLLKQNADPNQRLTKVSGKPTLLAYALDQELWDLAATALRYGANPNLAGDEKGHAPLVQAVQSDNVDAVALLIHHGANVNQLPLEVTTATENPQMIELLKTHGAVSA